MRLYLEKKLKVCAQATVKRMGLEVSLQHLQNCSCSGVVVRAQAEWLFPEAVLNHSCHGFMCGDNTSVSHWSYTRRWLLSSAAQTLCPLRAVVPQELYHILVATQHFQLPDGKIYIFLCTALSQKINDVRSCHLLSEGLDVFLSGSGRYFSKCV